MYCLLFPRSTAVYLYSPWPHQLDVTTQIQVDQTFPVVYILSHILIQRSFKEINQLDTYVMGSIGNRLEGVVSSHGGTQKWDILLSFLFYSYIFEIEVHLQWLHPALGLMARI